MIGPVAPNTGRLRPLGIDEVRITGGFWGRRQLINSTATLAHCMEWSDRVGWIGNFRAAAEGRLPRDRRGREFSDSEIYKLIEALSWDSARPGSARADVDELVTKVARAQEPDGYLNTFFGRAGQQARYSDLEWGHELYCYGHLLHAAVAQARVGGDGLVEIATRVADHLCDTFGSRGKDGICGHPGIETALVELARVTGEQRYLDQAKLFIDRRGHGHLADIELGRAYYQDEVPIRDATILRGHAVRALYLTAGAVDVAVETGDDALLEAAIAQWERTVARRTYLTGGMGSHHAGEAFGDDFVLPPDRAYSETCAGVASIMLTWRLLLATGDPRYADLIERTLFNVVATSPAEDGRSFFYANTLYQRSRGVSLNLDNPSRSPVRSLRAPWFDVSCCPMNLARMLASLPAYVATTNDEGLQLHQYTDADISTTLGDGRPVTLRTRTAYPGGGSITVEVVDAPQDAMTISLRIPSWAAGQAIVTEPGGDPQRRSPAAGQVDIHRKFRPGDVIQLALPVEPRFTTADPRIDAVRGMVAVERGPLVLCVESVDLPGDRDVDAMRVDPREPPVDHDGRVVVSGSLVEPSDSSWPYLGTGGRPVNRDDAEIPLVPYHTWANRGPATMRVWMPAEHMPY